MRNPATDPDGEPQRRTALLAFFQRRVSSYVEAEDLTHEVLARLASRRGDVRNPEGYMFQVASNLLRDRARRASIRRDYAEAAGLDPDLDIDPLDPHRIAAGREQLRLLARTLDGLPERTRLIFLLFRYEQIDQRTIAESIGISVSAVEKHVHRAMAAVMQALREGDR